MLSYMIRVQMRYVEHAAQSTPFQILCVKTNVQDGTMQANWKF
jgi:hypothetical protein